MVQFLDPHVEPGAEAHHYALGLGDALDTTSVRIGLLANGFADSETFVAELGRAIGRRLPDAEFILAAKPNPSLLVADDLFEKLRTECDAVVGAYGH
jgi:hypothetical protein